MEYTLSKVYCNPQEYHQSTNIYQNHHGQDKVFRHFYPRMFFLDISKLLNFAQVFLRFQVLKLELDRIDNCLLRFFFWWILQNWLIHPNILHLHTIKAFLSVVLFHEMENIPTSSLGKSFFKPSYFPFF